MLELIDAGVDAFRLNFAHDNVEFFEKLFHTIGEACAERRAQIPIVQDLQGPKIRVGEVENGKITVNSGENIEITTENLVGTNDKISTSYSLLVKDSKVGDVILIDEGIIKL